MALADMARVGIATESISCDDTNVDPLIQKAAELYCKWMYDYLGKGADWKIAYEKLRDSIALCWRYREVSTDE